MKQFLSILQIAAAFLVILLVLIQKGEGSGLGVTFGGSEGNVYRQRRGAEKMIFVLSVVFVVIFVVTSFLIGEFF